MISSNRYVSLWQMLQVNAQAFYATSADLQVMRTMVRDHGAKGTDLNAPLTDDDRAIAMGIAKQMANEVDMLGAKVTLAAVRRVVTGCEQSLLTYNSLIDLTTDIDRRLRDELDGRMVFCLSDVEAGFYSPAEPFIEGDFETKFVSAAFDLEEATKCFALDRHTAAVFHAVRVLEFGIRAIARCLDIPDPLTTMERNWATILKKIKERIDEKWPAGRRVAGDGVLFEELHASLDAVRNPLRNATMHPQAKYTMNEAYDVLRTVGGFMRKLSERCDENGLPKA